MTARLLIAVLCLAAASLGGCASPCDRLARDFQRHNDALLQDPRLAEDTVYNAQTVKLSADMVTYGCF
jgi:hypothetical protein